jgi:nucleotide-binding universal stress UspA family protein
MAMYESAGQKGLIVVGVDGSEGAKAALRFALDEAKLRQSRLRVVHTWQIRYSGGFGMEGFGPLVGADFEVRRAAEGVLHAVLQEAAPDADGLVIERTVAEGGAATVLVDESRNADLLVVGSRGLGGFAGLLLGSVGQQCAHHAACPVVIVHASSRPAYERAA